MKDFRQTKAFAKYLEASGWKTTNLSDGTYAYIFNLPLFGAFLRIPRPKIPIIFSEIDKLAIKYHAFAIKLEPDVDSSDLTVAHQLKQHGYKFDHWSIEPTSTLIIDLSLDEDKIFSAFHPKWRQNIRFAIKNSVEVKQTDDINTLIRHWQQNAKIKGYLIEKPTQTRVFWSEFKKQNQAFILTAVCNSEAVASALLIFWNKTCHLWHLGYSSKYPNLKPLYLLIWESILFAKEKGMDSFDFEGIEDSRYPYSKKTQATYFKKGFGGKEKEYPGSFIKFYNPLYKLAYQIVSRVNPAIFRLFFKSKPVLS